MGSNRNPSRPSVPAERWDRFFWASGSSEGSGGFVDNVYACNLSLALSAYYYLVRLGCAPNYSNGGGACNTTAGGMCLVPGSSMLWRMLLMPAYDGGTPNFATALCAKGPHMDCRRSMLSN